MPVVDRYGHFGGVARLVGDNDFLLAVCRREDKAAGCVKCDRRAVYSDGVHILFVNGDRLRLAVGLAVFYAGDNRACSVKHNAVRANVVRIARRIGQFDIDNVFVIGVNAERCGVYCEGHAVKLRFGKLFNRQQIFNRYRLTAVVGCGDRHRLRVLKEQTEGDIVEERFPTVLADFNFARGLFGVSPLRRDGHILGRHSHGNFPVPAHKGVALSCRVGRGGNIRSVVLCNGRDLAAACGVEGNRVARVLPQRLDCDVSGDGHGGVHRILRTVYLPRLELLSFGRNKLALRQIIRAAVQYLLGGHCGGDLLGQILRLGAAVRVKRDGMLVALFKRCGYGDVFLRLSEGIGILPNRNGGSGAVDGQRAEHIALVGGDGEHDKLVLIEQRRAVPGGFCGIHHRDAAVCAILCRHLVARRAFHCHADREILLPFLSRTRDNIKPRDAACSGAFQNHRAEDGKGLLPRGLRIIVLRDLPRNIDRDKTGDVRCKNPDVDLGELLLQILFPGNTNRLRRLHIPIVLLPNNLQIVPQNIDVIVVGFVPAGVLEENVVMEAYVIICRDRITAVFIRRHKFNIPARVSLVPHLDGQRVLYPEPQVAPVFPIRLQFLAGRKIDGLRLFDVGDQLRRGDIGRSLEVFGFCIDIPAAICVILRDVYGGCGNIDDPDARFRLRMLIFLPCDFSLLVQIRQLLLCVAYR